MLNELFATWRAEISMEIDAAQQELADAEVALSAAEVARNLARSGARKMATMIDQLTPVISGGFGGFPTRYAPIASALQVRVNDHQRTATSAEGPVAIAKSQISALREQIADLQLAIQQIDSIINPPQDDVDTADADQVEAEVA